MGPSLAGEWRQAGPAQRFASLVGGGLILVGLTHLSAWLVLGGAWQGPVSFRKPTTFGISFGLTTITLAWVTGQLQVTDRIRWLLLGPLAAADTYEVAWVAAPVAPPVAALACHLAEPFLAALIAVARWAGALPGAARPLSGPARAAPALTVAAALALACRRARILDARQQIDASGR